MILVASDQGDRTIGVVLTGLDSDGSIGVKAVKVEGGLTIAQLPGQAAHPDMPRSALATGVVDLELAVEDMARAIVAYVLEDGGRLAAPADAQPRDDDEALRAILDIVCAQLGLDFRGYKTAMLLRRIVRRMSLVRAPSMAAFSRLLLADTAETKALATDFLISMTEFFREPESWKALADDVLPALLASKAAGDSVRVWVPGCATGEEAYSLAMMLLEDQHVRERRLKIQVFATDIDNAALARASCAFALAIAPNVTSSSSMGLTGRGRPSNFADVAAWRLFTVGASASHC